MSKQASLSHHHEKRKTPAAEAELLKKFEVNDDDYDGKSRKFKSFQCIGVKSGNFQVLKKA